VSGEELARRAVACPGWRWLPGMRYQLINERGQIGGWMRASDRTAHLDALDARDDTNEVALPDLDDPATLGCLLALVREAWGDPSASPRLEAGWWRVYVSSYPGIAGGGATESEALVAALEAAPRREVGV